MRFLIDKTIVRYLTFFTLFSLTACGQEMEKFPHTGSESSEALMNVAISSKEDLHIKRERYYVATDGLRVRSSPSIHSSTIVGLLSRNDTVRVLETEIAVGEDKGIAIPGLGVID